MTDKEAIKYLQQLYPNGGHCWLDEQRIEAIGMAIDALSHSEVTKISDQQEPVNKDFETALAEMVAKAQTSVVEPLVVAAQWKDCLIELAKSEEPVSEDLEEAAKQYEEDAVFYAGRNISDFFKAGAKWQKTKDESTTEDLGEYINELSKQFPEVSFAKLSRIAVRAAKWQKQKDEKAINENALLYNARLEGIEIGKAEMKQQMIVKAVETTFNVSLTSGLYDKLWIKGCKEGDKLLVIKKDEL